MLRPFTLKYGNEKTCLSPQIRKYFNRLWSCTNQLIQYHCLCLTLGICRYCACEYNAIWMVWWWWGRVARLTFYIQYYGSFNTWKLLFWCRSSTNTGNSYQIWAFFLFVFLLLLFLLFNIHWAIRCFLSFCLILLFFICFFFLFQFQWMPFITKSNGIFFE